MTKKTQARRIASKHARHWAKKRPTDNRRPEALIGRGINHASRAQNVRGKNRCDCLRRRVVVGVKAAMSAFGGIADINPQRTAHNSAFPYIDPPTVIPLVKQVRCGALCAVRCGALCAVRCGSRPAIRDRWMIIQPQMMICEASNCTRCALCCGT